MEEKFNPLAAYQKSLEFKADIFNVWSFRDGTGIALFRMPSDGEIGANNKKKSPLLIYPALCYIVFLINTRHLYEASFEILTGRGKKG